MITRQVAQLCLHDVPLSVILQTGSEILIDDFDPEAHAQRTLAQKSEAAKDHAARMLRQTKVSFCMCLAVLPHACSFM